MGILLHTMATPELEPGEAVALAAELGFDGIELICQAGYRCGLAETASVREARALGAAAREKGTPLRVLSAYEKGTADSIAAERAAAVDRLKRVIDLAAAAGASSVRILAAHEVGEDAFAGALERLAASLRALSDHAVEHDGGFALLIENHVDTMATSAARTIAICRAVGRANVAILFDPANLAMLDAEDFATAYALQRPLIRHVHVKDALVENGRRHSTVPGEGGDPWPMLISRLVRDGYAGDYSLEYERRWLPELPPAEYALPRAKRYLQRCLSEGERAAP